MFPLNNDFGETVAFSGRITDPEAKTAKYVKSPETELFSKSRIFFGLDKRNVRLPSLNQSSFAKANWTHPML